MQVVRNANSERVHLERGRPAFLFVLVASAAMKLTRHSLGLPALVAAVCLIVPSAVLAPAAEGATVKGKVTNTRDLLNPVWTEANSPQSHRYTFREPSSSVPTESRI